MPHETADRFQPYGQDPPTFHNHLGYPDSPGIAAVDVLRIDDGLVAEHGDEVQPVPDDLPHPPGMF